ncbi:hypothetical protein VTO42DRAFT_1331 [Malbranchea cinnamomea]
MAPQMMKAVRFYPPGGIEQLKIQTEPIPKPKEGEVLIKVQNVAVIATEISWPIYQHPNGEYFTHIPGHDFSGTVVELGPGIDPAAYPEIQPGSKVVAFTGGSDLDPSTGFSAHEGAMAQYAIARITQIAPKPQNLSFAEAASIPLSALTAWQALHDHGKLQAGERLLITGAAGGTGIFAVQFAKLIGARVVGTASSERSFEILRDLGIDEIIDYKRNPNWQENVSPFDLVLDTVGGPVLDQCLKAIRRDGRVVNIKDVDGDDRAQAAAKGAILFIVTCNHEQLKEIMRLIEKGLVKTVVDSIVPFDKVYEAFSKGFEGHVHGKIVLQVADSQ